MTDESMLNNAQTGKEPQTNELYVTTGGEETRSEILIDSRIVGLRYLNGKLQSKLQNKVQVEFIGGSHTVMRFPFYEYQELWIDVEEVIEDEPDHITQERIKTKR